MSEDRETRETRDPQGPEPVVRVRIEHPVMLGLWLAVGAVILLPIVVFFTVLVVGIVLAGFGGL